MALLLQTFVLVLVLHRCLSRDFVKLRCSDSANSTASFTPSSDGVAGRYLLEWCANTFISARQWDVHVYYNSTGGGIPPLHSSFKADFNALDLGCPVVNNTVNICFSKALDLVFASLYVVKTYPHVAGKTLWGPQYVFNVQNSYTPETFTGTHKASSIISPNYEDEHTVWLDWIFHIPLTDYVINLCPNSSHDPTEPCTSLHNNCSLSSWSALRCAVRLQRGYCRLDLSHTAPWVNGELADIIHVHASDDRLCLTNITSGAGVVVREEGGVALWGVGGAAGGALLVGGALWLLRRRTFHNRKTVDSARHDASCPRAVPREPTCPRTVPREAVCPRVGTREAACPRTVLLVYARDCAALHRVVDCLADMLLAAGVQQVWDIHSARTCAAAGAGAGGGAGWLRERLRPGGATVLVLQTALLRWLYQTTESGDEMLGSRLQYRSPQYSDSALLPAALGHLRSAPRGELPYTKYYVATFEDASVHTSWIESWVTPLRLHSIPLGVVDLLRDVAGATPHVAHVLRLTAAVHDYVTHVTHTPLYHKTLLVDVS